jgi:hypothetical protein
MTLCYSQLTKADAPSVQSSGLGCNNNQCIWLAGTGFSANCTVTLFDTHWSVLTTLPGNVGGSCSDSLVTFQVPDSILNTYSSIFVNVTNNLTGEWSSPVTVSLVPSLPSSTGAGFVYYPQFNIRSWLTTDFANYPAIQTQFYRDLAVMASLGAKVVKLTVGPTAVAVQCPTGLSGSELETCVAGIQNHRFQIDSARMSGLLKNLPAAINIAAEFGMSTIVDFVTNEFYLAGYDSNGQITGFWPNLPKGNFYDFLYGYAGSNPPADMAQDIVNWETEIIRAVNTSSASKILYYNLSTEIPFQLVSSTEQTLWTSFSYYLTWDVLNTTSLNSGKVGLDAFPGVWGIDTAENFAVNRLAMDVQPMSTKPAYTEYHFYPNASNTNTFIQNNISTAIGQINDIFKEYSSARTRTGIGEFGAPYCSYGTQEGQDAAFISALAAASHASAPVFTNWGLWDATSGNCTTAGTYNDTFRVGLGAGAEFPRDVYGTWVQDYSDLKGGDFETGTSGWGVGGANASMQWGGDYNGQRDAATHHHYLRLTVGSPNSSGWLCGPKFPLKGSKLAVSAMVRTSFQSYSVDFHYYVGSSLSPNIISKFVKTDNTSMATSIAFF